MLDQPYKGIVLPVTASWWVAWERNIQCTMYNVQCTNIQCTMYNVQYTMYNVQIYNIQCTMYLKNKMKHTNIPLQKAVFNIL